MRQVKYAANVKIIMPHMRGNRLLIEGICPISAWFQRVLEIYFD